MQVQEIDKLLEKEYIPSEIERRRSVMMYFLVGILIALIKGIESDYEKYHLKQALGWWVLFVLVLLLSIVLLFIPFVRVIPILVILIFVIILGIFVKQAMEGKYVLDSRKILFPLFYGIGSWVVSLFEIEEDLKNNSKKEGQK